MGRPETQEMMPSVSSLRDQASRCGRLKKLSGKGILTSGTWRERFCLLVKNKLYYYENDEGNGTEKYCGTVNLDYFDTCTEASTRMARKATNVLVIGSSDKGFFESHSGRHYFSAETLPEMKEWVNAINSAMKNHIRKEKKTTRDGSLTPGQTKRDSSTKTKSKQQDDSPTGTLPRTGARLDNLTKGRPRGPQGRRLPRKPQRPNGTPNETDPVLDSEDEMGVARDSSHGRAATMVESSLETNLKIRLEFESKSEDELRVNNSIYLSDATSCSNNQSPNAKRLSFEQAWFITLPDSPRKSGSKLEEEDNTSDYSSMHGSPPSTKSSKRSPSASPTNNPPARNSLKSRLEKFLCSLL
ncbi:Pleckstrin y domain-containing family A member 6 [Folsomia candida]|uniref:Pleckstrin y domain-containing family A member 6 n=1 Tax=Folsomia candida TaxID=158441 RepID=A0A226F6P5_FOLCA|nr:Pleckstrin y domain-containing family A member 6 [Folsomia candida]